MYTSQLHRSGRHVHETISVLHATMAQLATHPENVPSFNLRLLPLTLERGALLAQAEWEERHGLECAQNAYDEERERVEEEWRKGRERVRERLLEGIEERRRRAREEKEGEGTTGTLLFFHNNLYTNSTFYRRRHGLLVAPTYHPQTTKQTRHIPATDTSWT